MTRDLCSGLLRNALALFSLSLLALAAHAPLAQAQTSPEQPLYSRVNSFGVFVAYSNDSSHILLGDASNRRLLESGVSYGRRLFLNRTVNWQYNLELLPLVFESDPVQVSTSTFVFSNPPATLTGTTALPTTGPCSPSSGTGTFPGGGTTFTYVNTCTRRWVAGEAISPVGFEWNFLPQRRLQPYFIGHGGYMYSSQPIPVANAGSFNFTFDLGAGLELYQSRQRSIRAEYRYHHISNNETAQANPGIDSGLMQVTYSFGR